MNKSEIDAFYELWGAVFYQAMRDKNTRFFKSDYFKFICKKLGICPSVVIGGMPEWFVKRLMKNPRKYTRKE